MSLWELDPLLISPKLSTELSKLKEVLFEISRITGTLSSSRLSVEIIYIEENKITKLIIKIPIPK